MKREKNTVEVRKTGPLKCDLHFVWFGWFGLFFKVAATKLKPTREIGTNVISFERLRNRDMWI